MLWYRGRPPPCSASGGLLDLRDKAKIGELPQGSIELSWPQVHVSVRGIQYFVHDLEPVQVVITQRKQCRCTGAWKIGEG
jgi:expansin (peptidoglycan-binding protein)